MVTFVFQSVAPLTIIIKYLDFRKSLRNMIVIIIMDLKDVAIYVLLHKRWLINNGQCLYLFEANMEN